MIRLIQKYGWPLIGCVLVFGSLQLAHSDAAAPGTGTHRQEVREGLAQMQSNLDQLLGAQLLTVAQHKTLSERVRQLEVQIHVDAQAPGDMTEEDRNTQFNLIDQIKQEARRLADANRASAAASAAASTNSGSAPVATSSAALSTSSAPVSSSSAPTPSPSH